MKLGKLEAIFEYLTTYDTTKYYLYYTLTKNLNYIFKKAPKTYKTKYNNICCFVSFWKLTVTASSPCPDSKLRVVYICIETYLLCNKWTVSASYPCPDSRLLYCTFGNCHLRDKWTVTASFPCPVHPVQLETVISAIKGGCQPPTPVLIPNSWTFGNLSPLRQNMLVHICYTFVPLLCM